MSRLDRAIEDLDLEDWLSENGVEFKKLPNSHELILKECPKCFKDKWKLYVNTEKKLFDCKHCNWGRSIRDICVLMSGTTGIHINDVKVDLAKAMPATLTPSAFAARVKKDLKVSSDEDEEDLVLAMDIVKIPGEPSFTGITSKAALKYAKKRGLSDDFINKSGLRFSLDLNTHRGPWIVFPLFYYKYPVAWQGRKTVGDKEPKYVSSDTIAHYVYPIDTDSINQIESEKYVIITEGIFDALAFKSLGLPAVCTFGKKISSSQVSLLQKHKVEKIYLAWDPEAVKDIVRAAETYIGVFDTYVVQYPPELKNLDPGKCLSDESLRPYLQWAVDNAISVDSSDLYLMKVTNQL